MSALFPTQTEALGRKRTKAKATAAAFMRRSRGSYRNARGRRSYRNVAEHQGSNDNEDVNGDDGGRDLSSGDERTEPRPKRSKRWRGDRYYQPSSAAANADSDDENDYEMNKSEILGASVGRVGSSERLSWGKGGMRSHTRYGSSSGGNGKNARLSLECVGLIPLFGSSLCSFLSLYLLSPHVGVVCVLILIIFFFILYFSTHSFCLAGIICFLFRCFSAASFFFSKLLVGGNDEKRMP